MDEREDTRVLNVEDPSFLVFDREGYRSACAVVTITAQEYRELCGKTALWDEYRADVERWCDGGEA